MPTFEEILDQNFNPLRTERLESARERLNSRRAENQARLTGRQNGQNTGQFQNFAPPTVIANQDEWLVSNMNVLNEVFDGSLSVPDAPGPGASSGPGPNDGPGGGDGAGDEFGAGGINSPFGPGGGSGYGGVPGPPGLLHPAAEFLLGPTISKLINQVQQPKVDAFNEGVQDTLTNGVAELSQLTGFSESDINDMLNSTDPNALDALGTGFTQTDELGLTTTIGDGGDGGNAGNNVPGASGTLGGSAGDFEGVSFGGNNNNNSGGGNGGNNNGGGNSSASEAGGEDDNTGGSF